MLQHLLRGSPPRKCKKQSSGCHPWTPTYALHEDTADRHGCKLTGGSGPNTADPQHANTKYTQQASCSMLHTHTSSSGCLEQTMHHSRKQEHNHVGPPAVPPTTITPKAQCAPQNALLATIDALNGTSGESRAWSQVNPRHHPAAPAEACLAVEVHSPTA